MRFNGSSEPLSPKSIRNVWVTFRSFFSWLQVEFKYPNPAKEISAPKFQKHPVDTFTKEEVERILKACVYSRESQTEVRKKFVMRRPSANRDQAIILMLLDTGVRATELCSLMVGDVDLKTGKVTIRHGVGGGAKGGKGRSVYLGKVARKAVWRYLAGREDGDDPDAPLFISQADRPFNKDSLRVLINRLGSRAEVQKTYPTNSDTPSRSPTCVLAGMFSRCNRCWDTARWIWCATMPRLRMWMWRTRIAKPARPITCACRKERVTGSTYRQ